jgi:hypothetical protein
MRKRGENSVKFAGKNLRFRLTKMMISRFGAESQTARYIGQVAMTRLTSTLRRHGVGTRYFGPSHRAITPG